VFHLGGAGANFDLNRITNVQFFYGTAIGEGSVDGHPVPTPGALAMLALGGLMVASRRRRA
jgi:hypothetical protein